MGQPVFKPTLIPIKAIRAPAQELMAKLDFVVMLVTYVKQEAGEDVSDVAGLVSLSRQYRRDKPDTLQEAIEGVVGRMMLKYGQHRAVELLRRCDLGWFCRNYPTNLRIENDDIYFWD